MEIPQPPNGYPEGVPEQLKQPAIRQGWLRAVLFMIAFLIIYTITSLIGILVIAMTTGLDLGQLLSDEANLISELGPWLMFIVMLIAFAGTMLTVWLFRKFVDRKSVVSLGLEWQGFSDDFVKGGLWGIALIGFGFLLQFALGLINITGFAFDPLAQLGYIFLFSVVALNEEIMVRGYLLDNLMDSFGNWPALLFSSVIFSLMHGLNANVTALSMLNLLIAGVLLGIYYLYRRNLWFPIAMHLTWNYLQGPVLGYEVSGNKTGSIVQQDISGSDLLTGGDFGFEGSLLATIMMIAAIVGIHMIYSRESSDAQTDL